MTVAQCKRARKRMALRYAKGGTLTIAQSVERERQRAARQDAMKGKKKK